MEIKKENAIAAYNAANEDTKKVLLSLLPELEEEIRPKDITKCVKTFEDACRELGEEHPFVVQYKYNCNNISFWKLNVGAADLGAFLRLRIVCAALNEGWKPQFTEDEKRWYPSFELLTKEDLSKKSKKWKANMQPINIGGFSGEWAGFVAASLGDTPSATTAGFGCYLCLKSEALAVYCGKQFIRLWADFNLIRK